MLKFLKPFVVLALLTFSPKVLAHEWVASTTYYHNWYHGRQTASGEWFSQYRYTAAHPSLPYGTWLEVSWRGRSVIVKVNDTCNCELDLTRQAAADLGMLRAGRVWARVRVLNRPIKNR